MSHVPGMQLEVPEVQKLCSSAETNISRDRASSSFCFITSTRRFKNFPSPQALNHRQDAGREGRREHRTAVGTPPSLLATPGRGVAQGIS